MRSSTTARWESPSEPPFHAHDTFTFTFTFHTAACRVPRAACRVPRARKKKTPPFPDPPPPTPIDLRARPPSNPAA